MPAYANSYYRTKSVYVIDPASRTEKMPIEFRRNSNGNWVPAAPQPADPVTRVPREVDSAPGGTRQIRITADDPIVTLHVQYAGGSPPAEPSYNIATRQWTKREILDSEGK